MPASIAEFYRSPSITGDLKSSSSEITYKITGTEDETAAYALLLATAPATLIIDGYVLAKRVFGLEHDDYGVWTGTCRFSKRELEVSESTYQFETGGGNTHITHSIATVQSIKLGGGTAPNNNNAIGWNGREIAGCDIISPVYNFSETHVLAAVDVDAAYKLALFRATGKVNNAGFKGFATGEVLFLGASGSLRTTENEWEISYRFAASENATGLSVGGITGINKKGWEYLWLYFQDEVSQDVLVKKPLAAYVEQVYQTADFSTIGIGT
jgi:hypothetical protein